MSIPNKDTIDKHRQNKEKYWRLQWHIKIHQIFDVDYVNIYSLSFFLSLHGSITSTKIAYKMWLGINNSLAIIYCYTVYNVNFIIIRKPLIFFFIYKASCFSCTFFWQQLLNLYVLLSYCSIVYYYQANVYSE